MSCDSTHTRECLYKMSISSLTISPTPVPPFPLCIHKIFKIRTWKSEKKIKKPQQQPSARTWMRKSTKLNSLMMKIVA